MSPRPLVACRPLLPLLLGLATAILHAQSAVPAFSSEGSVHDPSVLRAGSEFFVFGSHLASAKTTDLMNWTQLSSSPVAGNALAPAPQTTFAEGIAWIGGASNFWAPDVYRLPDGRYYLYYCLCEGSSPRGTIGLAVADAPGGPYTDQGLLLKSGMWGQTSPDGTIYDATKHPNAVDPCVFADTQGRLWMVYGSYSGGIFILQLNPTTGRPLAGQGYGKKLIGGNHVQIEAPYILHNPATGYYYLFLSFGGLDSAGGYQIRVGRSLNPDGPYLDPTGTNLSFVSGPAGSFFDLPSIAPYGGKLIGNYQFLRVDGEPGTTTRGYLSPGHNSAWRDPATGQSFIFFHTRFVGRGEAHEVRVHRLHFNSQGWPVIAPHRYAGEGDYTFTSAALAGRYKIINHAKDISSTLRTSTLVTFGADGTVSGDANGTWALEGNNYLTLTLAGTTYRGVFTRQWDDDNKVWVIGFTSLSSGGVSVWGSAVAAANLPPSFIASANATVPRGQLFERTVVATEPDFAQSVTYGFVTAPTGATINATTGVISWTPQLYQAGRTHRFTLRATDNAASPRTAFTGFDVTVSTPTVLNRSDLEFTAAGTAGLRDANGLFTGLGARLPGTGSSVPTNDPLLALETSGTGALALTTTRTDYYGAVELATNRSVGVPLSSLGFTGAQDFAVTAIFRTPPALGYVDQVGLFVGANASTLTRAGIIVFGTSPEGYSTHTVSAADTAGRFGGAVSLADGLTVTIQRSGGVWRHWVEGVEWNPAAYGVKSEASFLNGFTNLTAGVFAMTPFNTNAKTVRLESLTSIVDSGLPLLTALETWRQTHFGSSAATGNGADDADPDGDGLANLLEYALGSTPVSSASAAPPQVGAQTETTGARRLTLTFARIADAALLYAVEGADSLAGPWTTQWTSTGTANVAGPVTVPDGATLPAAGGARFLRLRVSR